MTDVYIYDHVRTPRGKGKPDDGLHEITSVQLAAQMMGALRDRNSLDTSLVEDVLLGCVVSVGEQFAPTRLLRDIAKNGQVFYGTTRITPPAAQQV
ncbi:hypothetical protein [Denitratisoma oestradiolicum]|uniref:Acetyl-CoA C-acyltransferase n=1 Tax=Denitratisoma oestradiolicum TaxID=311182 RepID=A0A6S6XXV7_9PROT|nr:hypothetical protein [Denitratisoma oestradiolicum]CAB1369709.1 protein of unknown function [Denitratisoma oestradiolicum]